ncbi:MAG TPA: glycosyl hydrolase, partial [Flavitalea sp.]|nr:glycosyl hydrolase [Flavitalea sp.]
MMNTEANFSYSFSSLKNRCRSVDFRLAFYFPQNIKNNFSTSLILKCGIVLFTVLLNDFVTAQQVSTAIPKQGKSSADNYATLYKNFKNPPQSSHPWVFWYWMHASVSKAGITADLEAMKEVGIGGAYLMPIKDTVDSISIKPAMRQLSPEWWELVKHSLTEAKRLGLQIGMHISDGFALAGGPWITPELSMQKIVWADTTITGGREFKAILPQPKMNAGYYKDVAVYAFPTMVDASYTTEKIIPRVSTSTGLDAQYLMKRDNRQTFGSNDSCWIQYEFDQPFICRQIIIRTAGNNFQSHRLLIEASDDGKNFYSIGRLQPPRHGWQDTDADVTHLIKPTTARFFRFVYNKAGSEPGAEDLDAAKWNPSLRIRGINLSGASGIHQYEGKNGNVWRVSERTTKDQLPDTDCIPKNQLIDITQYLSEDGHLTWIAPEGKWTILRMGHTSTGQTNATGGAGKGLECDKFNPDAIRLQFNNWFGEAVRQAGPTLTRDVLTVMHVDSWECGSQNWSPVFREQFQKRRGYDPLLYLPVMAGIPVISNEFSEAFLYDIRNTIAELVVDQFYNVLAEEAKSKGV